MLGVLVRRTFYSELFLGEVFLLSLCSDVILYQQLLSFAHEQREYRVDNWNMIFYSKLQPTRV